MAFKKKLFPLNIRCYVCKQCFVITLSSVLYTKLVSCERDFYFAFVYMLLNSLHTMFFNSYILYASAHAQTTKFYLK